MRLCSGVKALVPVLLSVLVVAGCGRNDEEQQVATAIDQALRTQGLGYWQVDDISIEDKRDEDAGPLKILTYEVEATLELDKPLREILYVDEDNRRVVTRTGLEEGSSRELAATVQISRSGEDESVITTLDEADLPQGMLDDDFARHYKGWEIIAAGSDDYDELVDELDAYLAETQVLQSEAADSLGLAQVRLMASQAELAVLEKNAEEMTGLADAMEQSSQEVEAMLQRVAELEAVNSDLLAQVERAQDDLDRLTREAE